MTTRAYISNIHSYILESFHLEITSQMKLKEFLKGIDGSNKTSETAQAIANNIMYFFSKILSTPKSKPMQNNMLQNMSILKSYFITIKNNKQYVTVFAKTSLVRTINENFFSIQLVAMYNS